MNKWIKCIKYKSLSVSTSSSCLAQGISRTGGERPHLYSGHVHPRLEGNVLLEPPSKLSWWWQPRGRNSFDRRSCCCYCDELWAVAGFSDFTRRCFYNTYSCEVLVILGVKAFQYGPWGIGTQPGRRQKQLWLSKLLLLLQQAVSCSWLQRLCAQPRVIMCLPYPL